MKPAFQTTARDFSPSTDAAHAAASHFIANANTWSGRFQSAKNELESFVSKALDQPVRGMLSSDPLNMSVFGVILDKNPTQGFIPVPSNVAADIRKQGIRGDAYFPDKSNQVGKQALALMNDISRVAEQRPLLTHITGVAPIAVEGGRVVLSRAVQTDAGIVVKAARSAVAPVAQITPVAQQTMQAGVKPVDQATSRPRSGM